MAKAVPTFFGIEIGGAKLQVLVGDASGKILQRHRLTVEPAQGADGIRTQLEATLKQILAKVKPAAVGVGFGGPVDWRTGKITRSHQIEGWSDFELAIWLETMTQAPVVVDNDANVAAFGEAYHGTGAGLDPVFYVTLGSGVGGGLVTGGRIYHGASPGESEIGHIRLDRNGTTIESRCSGWAVDAKIRALMASDPTSLLAGLIGEKTGGEARHLAEALHQKDKVARKILRETAEDLAFGLSHVVHLFHPQAIIIGGGLSHLGDPLQTAVAHAIRHFVMEAFMPGPRIFISTLGEDAVPIGALELAKMKFAGQS